MFLDKESFLPAAPAEVDLSKLKPSEAMRRGAKMRPQCFGALFWDGGSCPLAAMWEGYGNKLLPDKPMEAHSAVAEMTRKLGIDPHAITQRNDILHWTREQIADWLEAQGK